ncbi:hypothetical protein GCM10009017_15290 [Halarchaeum rubridurum]|uniref:HVO-2833 C-terminal domain-containing protein n=1 Tax=Halarchaeum rubridurum TaxID=489911 RepID=A0A830FYA4_9EURY|nr:hypothetical protein GCM10009017_15290 [Halarchaeum rubridurum]
MSDARAVELYPPAQPRRRRRGGPPRAGGEYGLEAEIDVLLRYLETQGDVDDDRLPEWDEFQQLAADYEVRLS